VPEGLSVARLAAAMATDKKRRGGVPRLVVPHAPGDVRVHEDVQPAAVERAWRAVGAA
jgi:3-dehydroquinate synthetase